MAAAASALILLPVGNSALADEPPLGDSGPSTPYTPDVAPAWKARMAELWLARASGSLTAAQASEWNSLVTSHGFAASAAIPTGASGAAAVAASVPASLDLAGTQRPQTQTYYCGPASAMSIVLSWHNHNAVLYPTTSAYEPGLGLSQLNLADVTYTNADPQGFTDWAKKDMIRALNRWIFNGGVVYVQVTPTSATDLQNKVTQDVGLGMMLADQMVELQNGSHYNYHPNRSIYHWSSIRGYANSGASLHFQDPAANTSVLGSDWSAVTPYFTISSSSAYFYMTKNGVSRGVDW